jgi:hypothetical protein
MAKAHTLISIDPEVLDQLKIKYPGEISKLANDYFKDLLEINNKNNPNKNKDIQQLIDEILEDEITLNDMETKTRQFRIELNMKRENLVFKKSEDEKRRKEDFENTIMLAKSIKASGIMEQDVS